MKLGKGEGSSGFQRRFTNLFYVLHTHTTSYQRQSHLRIVEDFTHQATETAWRGFWRGQEWENFRSREKKKERKKKGMKKRKGRPRARFSLRMGSLSDSSPKKWEMISFLHCLIEDDLLSQCKKESQREGFQTAFPFRIFHFLPINQSIKLTASSSLNPARQVLFWGASWGSNLWVLWDFNGVVWSSRVWISTILHSSSAGFALEAIFHQSLVPKKKNLKSW